MGYIKKEDNKYNHQKELDKNLYIENIKFLDPVLNSYAKAIKEKKTFGIYIPDDNFKESAIFSFNKILKSLKRRGIDVPENLNCEFIFKNINKKDGEEDEEGRIIYKHYGTAKHIYNKSSKN